MRFQPYEHFTDVERKAISECDPLNMLQFRLRGGRDDVYLFPDFVEEKAALSQFEYLLRVKTKGRYVLLRLNVYWFKHHFEAQDYEWETLRPHKNAKKFTEILAANYSLAEVFEVAKKMRLSNMPNNHQMMSAEEISEFKKDKHGS